MIRRGRRQWDQDTRLPPRAQLRHRHRTRAREDKIGSGIRAGDRIKESAHDNAARYGSRRVPRLVQRTGTPEQIHIVEETVVEGARNSLVQGARALAPSDDERSEEHTSELQSR